MADYITLCKQKLVFESPMQTRKHVNLGWLWIVCVCGLKDPFNVIQDCAGIYIYMHTIERMFPPTTEYHIALLSFRSA